MLDGTPASTLASLYKIVAQGRVSNGPLFSKTLCQHPFSPDQTPQSSTWPISLSPPTAAPILLIPAPLCPHRSRYAGFLAIAQETLSPRYLTGLFLQIIVSAQNLLFEKCQYRAPKKKKKSNFTTPHFSSAALFFLQSLAHLAYYALLISYLPLIKIYAP